MAGSASEQPGIDIGRVLRLGLGVVGRRFLPMTALILVLDTAPQAAIRYQWLVDSRSGLALFKSPYFWMWVAAATILGTLIPATLIRISIRDLRGRDPDVAGSLVESLKLILPLVGIGILKGLAIGIGTIFLIVPGVIAYLALIVAVPAFIEERLGLIGSLQRSMDLTRGSRALIFVLFLLWVLAFTVIPFALRVLFSAVADGALWAQVAQEELGGAVIVLLSAPIVSALYIELHTAKEGPMADEVASVFT
jgi:hypothetical protein